jgi:hypothetical protein
MNLTIVSLCDDNRRRISDITAPTVKELADNTGIRFVRHTSLIVPTLHAHWNKFLAIVKEFETSDWVMWLDADIAVVNPNYDLRALIQSYGDANMLTSSDFNGLCAGAFLLRRCDWSHAFVNTCLFLKEPHEKLVVEMNGGIHRPYSDQDCIKMLMNTFPTVTSAIKLIPDAIIQNSKSKFRPDAFAVHYWAAFVEEEIILKRINEIQTMGWTEQGLKIWT